MLFMAEMEVRLPPEMPPAQAEELRAREREYSHANQRSGRWPHLWRVAGRYANVSILDVGSVDELHELLSGLPLFPYLDIRVTPLARHPNALGADEPPTDP
ncbi:MAG: muconolactone Delta-isomerase [Solirubrobacteraceae bacterium]